MALSEVIANLNTQEITHALFILLTSILKSKESFAKYEGPS